MRAIPALASLILLGGSSSASLHDQLPQAATAGLVYVDMPANLQAETHTEGEMIAGGSIFTVLSAGIGAAVVGANLDLNLRADHALAERSKLIETLPFRDEMFDHTQAIVQGSPWLPAATLDRTTELPDEPDKVWEVMQQQHRDRMVCIWPVVLLDRIGQSVHVGYHVAVFVTITDNYGNTRAERYRYREFVYSYPLRLHYPTPSWQQQKADAQLIAGMSVEDAVPYWLADDGAQLRRDFADALPKLDGDMARYFGSSVPGR